MTILSPPNRRFPHGIDIYFDNVGGAMLDATLLNMRVNGRIAVCGIVSLPSYRDPNGIHNLFCLLMKRVTMKGFLQSDYLHLYPQFLEHVISNYKQGKIVYVEDMNEGLESAPAAFVGLFSGVNVGKQVVRVAHEWLSPGLINVYGLLVMKIEKKTKLVRTYHCDIVFISVEHVYKQRHGIVMA